jgi:ELWxxDGT repeat protein
MKHTRLHALAVGALLTATLLAASPQAATGAPAAAAPALPVGLHPLLAGATAQPDTGVVLGGRLWFAAQTSGPTKELWSSDGTAAGTAPLGRPDLKDPSHLTLLGDRIVFEATDDTLGRELWTTDGTLAGTRLLRDVRPGSESSGPANETVVGQTLYFTAYDSTGYRELWHSDGTSGGTAVSPDINGTEATDPDNLRAIDGRLFFSATHKGSRKPFVTSPGVPLLTRLDADLDQVSTGGFAYAAAGAHVVFAATTVGHGTEPWVTDGKAGDAHELVDLDPQPAGKVYSSNPNLFTTLGGRAVFVATDGVTGTEPWVTDGTAAGTVLLADANPGPASSGPASLTPFGDQVLFTSVAANGHRVLWTSRGTPSTTAPIADPGAVRLFPAATSTVAGRLLFDGEQPVTGAEPWVTDGTPAGTHLLTDLSPGKDGSDPYTVGVLGTTAVFGAAGGLWSWDATATSPPKPVATRTTLTAKRHYSAAGARHRKVVLEVAVAGTSGVPLSGGAVTLTAHGRVLGTAPLVGGTARVRITERLRPGHRYAVTATWSGTAGATGSTSAPVPVRIQARPHRHHR